MRPLVVHPRRLNTQCVVYKWHQPGINMPYDWLSPKSSTVLLWFQHQPTPGNGCCVSLPLQVLRFYRLFGLPQPNLLPQLWRGMKKKKKKRHASGSEAAPQESPPPSPPRKTIEGWEYKYSSSPPPEDCMPDDAVRFCLQISHDL